MMGGSRNRTAFDDYLQQRKSDAASQHTHTRIGSKQLNVYGGSYSVGMAEMETFWKLYHEHVFVKGKQEFLTERQLPDNGPILVDVDMRFSTDVDSRKYTIEHVTDLVMLYIEKLTVLLDIPTTARMAAIWRSTRGRTRAENASARAA